MNDREVNAQEQTSHQLCADQVLTHRYQAQHVLRVHQIVMQLNMDKFLALSVLWDMNAHKTIKTRSHVLVGIIEMQR